MAKFKTIAEATAEAEAYIKGRMEGTIRSLNTGYKKLNKTMIDGLEWNSTITLGGRPSVGKSAVSDCIVDGCFANNIGVDGRPDFLFLDFNWELSSRVMLIRRLSAKFKNTYKHILSADDNRITMEEFKEMSKFLREHYNKLPITFCEEPLTVKEFGATVRKFCNENKGKRVLIRVDHTLLAKQSASESGQVAMLLNLLMEANAIKKEYPVIFIFLTQINREFEERQIDGTDTAFPRQGDVYGGDAAAMFSETIILLNKPSKYGIRQYGRRNNGVPVIEDDDLYFHVVKNRNSNPDLMLHYKEDFRNMSIKEI